MMHIENMQTRVCSGKSRITPLSNSREALENYSKQIPRYNLDLSRGGFSLPEKLDGVIMPVRTGSCRQKVANLRAF